MGNALSVDLQHSLMSRLKQVNEEHRDVRAVVLTGRGKLFCTGMNLSSSGESLMGNHTEQYDRRESESAIGQRNDERLTSKQSTLSSRRYRILLNPSLL